MPPPLSDLNLYWHPQLLAGYLHLCLGTTVVTQKIQHPLHDAATKQSYFKYLTDKFPGLNTLAHDIHWQTLCYTLKWFKVAKRRMISKFIHKWLPLQDCHQTISISWDHKCPSCQQTAKTVNHFLSCQHQDQLQVWKDLHEQLHLAPNQALHQQHIPQASSCWSTPWPKWTHYHCVSPCTKRYPTAFWISGMTGMVATLL